LIFAAWLSWLVPLLSVPLIPLASKAGSGVRNAVAVAASGTGMASALFAAFTFGAAATETVRLWFPPLSVAIQVQVDGLSVLVGAFVSFVSFLVVVYSLGYMKGEPGQTRYYSLVLLFIGAMMGLVMAGNLIQFYFFWEIVGVCSALLIAFWSDRPAARRAGLKAFVVTRLGDSSLLVAVIVLAVIFGTTSFNSLLGPGGVATLGSGTAFVIGLLMLFGAMGKSAQVPLHGWLPDAMEGPTTVSALIHAATMVNAGVYLMLRMYPLISLPQLRGSLLAVVLAVGLASALVGGVCAFAADDIKRVLAYSTISQLGFMFAAIGLGSLTAAAYHMISQGLFKALAFLAAGSVITALGTREMSQMGGLYKAMKYTYLGFLVSMLAMSGVPPLVGFWSKDAILSLAFGAGSLTAVLVLAGFALTALYSFRAVFRVFHGEPRGAKVPTESPPSMLAPIVVLVASVAAGWAILQSQSLLQLASFWSPALDSFAAALAVLGVSAATAYAITLPYHSRAVALVRSRRSVTVLRIFLFEGLWFDRLYNSVFDSVISPVSRGVSRLQTELLGENMGLAVALVALLFVLYAAGVL
jgi:NADH-quinone oxidoreductase subunit L